MTDNNHKIMRVLPASFFNLMLLSIILMGVMGTQVAMSLSVYADGSLSISQNIKRVHLIKKITDSPQSLQSLKNEQIAMVLRDPTLKRNEMNVTAWHYHGESCALDIYFSSSKNIPDYIEYRPLVLNADVDAQFQTTDTETRNNYCLKDILEARGVNTPDYFATRPLPLQNNPYRS